MIELTFNATNVRLMSGASLMFHGKIAMKPSQVWLLVGENASGKTTLLSLIESALAGKPQGIVHRFDYGSVEVKSDISGVGSVFQEPRENFISSSSSDDFILPLLNSSQSAQQALEYIHDIADAVDPKRRRVFERNIDRLSSGEQQKLALGACLAPRPGLMLWDEALSRIDEPSAIELMKLLNSLQGDTIVVAATHRGSRDRKLFGDRCSGVISIKRDRHEVFLDQHGLDPESATRLDAEPFRFPRILADRVGPRITADSAKKLFKNGFRVFSESDATKLGLRDFEVCAGSQIIYAPRDIVINERLNVVIGSNGSGKTLFLRILAGEIPLNPWWKGRGKVSATAELALTDWGSPRALRNAGQSVYMPAEPYKWLTDEFVHEEMSRFLDGSQIDDRLEMLRGAGVAPDQVVGSLSYGQRKLVCLLSLPQELDLVCIDEPFADLSNESAAMAALFINKQILSGAWRVVVLAQCNDTKALTDELS